jgi:hypothetical protein
MGVTGIDASAGSGRYDWHRTAPAKGPHPPAPSPAERERGRIRARFDTHRTASARGPHPARFSPPSPASGREDKLRACCESPERPNSLAITPPPQFWANRGGGVAGRRLGCSGRTAVREEGSLGAHPVRSRIRLGTRGWQRSEARQGAMRIFYIACGIVGCMPETHRSERPAPPAARSGDLSEAAGWGNSAIMADRAQPRRGPLPRTAFCSFLATPVDPAPKLRRLRGKPGRGASGEGPADAALFIPSTHPRTQAPPYSRTLVLSYSRTSYPRRHFRTFALPHYLPAHD